MQDFILLTVSVSLMVTLANCQKNITLCEEGQLKVNDFGQSGRITFNATMAVRNPCRLTIDACSRCKIHIKGWWYDNSACDHTLNQLNCAIGCSHMFIFDKHYMDETLRYPRHHFEFISESSDIIMGFCHAYSVSETFTFDYQSLEKKQRKEGSSNPGSSYGFISSPFFPHNYAQNSELYIYEITSLKSGDKIRITFEDWYLAESSRFFFNGTKNYHTLVYGRDQRPVVDSVTNRLSFTFHTGIPLTAGENRNYLGFTARYDFLSGLTSMPETDCKTKEYLMTEYGGTIRFSGKTGTSVLYDCLWVVKTQLGFDATYLQVNRFKSNSKVTYRGDNSLVIRKGLTSRGTTIGEFKIEDEVEFSEGFEDQSGFYLRLRGHFDQHDDLVIIYNSFKKDHCGSDLYQCRNGRCISNNLKCDDYNHCKDNSDEGAYGCGDGISPYNQNSYTITVGVIVPMVISIFLIMIICLLFILIRRCRRARREAAEGGSPIERIQTLSEEVTSRRGRRQRRHRHRVREIERDLPPTYDEAIQNPPGWYSDVAFSNPVDPTMPQPPTYTEAVEAMDTRPNNSGNSVPLGSPSTSESSQSEVTVGSHHLSSDSSDEGSTWENYGGDGEGRRGRRERHVSSSGSEESVACQNNQRSERHERSQPDVENNRERRCDTEQPVENRGLEMQVRKLNEKLIVKDTDNVDAFVIPDGPKPGMNDNAERPQLQTTAAVREDSVDAANPSQAAETTVEQTSGQQVRNEPHIKGPQPGRPKPPRTRVSRQRRDMRNEEPNENQVRSNRNPISRSVPNLTEGETNYRVTTGSHMDLRNQGHQVDQASPRRENPRHYMPPEHRRFRERVDGVRLNSGTNLRETSNLGSSCNHIPRSPPNNPIELGVDNRNCDLVVNVDNDDIMVVYPDNREAEVVHRSTEVAPRQHNRAPRQQAVVPRQRPRERTTLPPTSHNRNPYPRESRDRDRHRWRGLDGYRGGPPTSGSSVQPETIAFDGRSPRSRSRDGNQTPNDDACHGRTQSSQRDMSEYSEQRAYITLDDENQEEMKDIYV